MWNGRQRTRDGEEATRHRWGRATGAGEDPVRELVAVPVALGDAGAVFFPATGTGPVWRPASPSMDLPLVYLPVEAWSLVVCPRPGVEDLVPLLLLAPSQRTSAPTRAGLPPIRPLQQTPRPLCAPPVDWGAYRVVWGDAGISMLWWEPLRSGPMSWSPSYVR